MKPIPDGAPDADIAEIAAGQHPDPFAVLGPHPCDGGVVIRAFAPGARTLAAVFADGVRYALDARSEPGFFEGVCLGKPVFAAYRLVAANEGGAWEWDDPYRFGPILGEMDDHLLVEGAHLELYRRLGAHVLTHEGVEGVHFSVWAPHAARVSVVGDFNAWDGRRHPMRKRVDSGLWEIFIPDLGQGVLYKYEILSASGDLMPLKADPFGQEAQLRPSTASAVPGVKDFAWTDADYLAARAPNDPRRAPMTIYEVHLGSWRRGDDNRFLTYDELADSLIPYARDQGFTHLELLPVSEHPLDASWGYQPIGLFAPTSRFGDAEGFKRFMDRAHAEGLGVILDWVPAHFPTDEHGLAWFDGEPLYEHADPRRGFHPDWNTAIYDFGRREIANFLAVNALYWFEQFHIDGLRVDAVASMLYLDYSRKEGEWTPNQYGGKENLEAIAFLQRVNRLVYERYPGALMIAEESTAWPGVSQPVHSGGLGFGFKWNMGWMNDTLRYVAQDPAYRRWSHHQLTFGLLYAFAENFILPISHDEVVHGKGSVVGKMPGDEWQKFANARAYYAFMWAHPGKKLLFMGQDFGQTAEWTETRSLDWHLLEFWPHAGLSRLVRDLNHLYRAHPALHARDCEDEGFQWLVVDDEDNSVFAWLRRGGPDDPPIAVVVNFTPVPRPDYRIPLPAPGRWREILNSDSHDYGGSGLGNFGEVHAHPEPCQGQPASARVMAPPLAALYLILEPEAEQGI
ncbi:1,4-alpha-glucan branching protein GlgB [Rhodoblastus acidophilus]|uniref:1,4-alpha-glucan branching enzyme GlgB n=1 Tax=Candidatus Rhodoblastus alkanivorans TaxID=2954117 RepID=A0ABS9Z736_9HYPH|nr:1,4-alpha-glucan branching protein GlgB [Candidatus Rhodoblastus alkanivorans]MCI4678716.1 1,4-alpha-glucan branching protein GlgB [Candidatus Rhodoblastus alkanivorans]MCI4683488.1 1,4-alpha-glucan branching protein GlgB [Candidatus Rhodoblastus alkanivorans]MDI4640802.1 1,4-alpha-glucan branching protein GlgB [Rhodoblastus acidophilus]